MSAFVKMGVRYRVVGAHKHRWGEGKVHLEFWDGLNRMWTLACRANSHGNYHASELNPSTPITCKVCLKKDPR